MIKINGLRINIINKKGLFGNEFTFEKGLNIIRGNNSSGKSTVFQSLLYGLGMEELIGGKNTAALQYNKLRVKTDSIIKDFRDLSKQYAKILGEIKDLPSSFYSPLDFQKMKYLNTEFKQLLTKFNYRSYEVNEISIPYDGYFPTVQGLNLVKTFDNKKDEKKTEGKLKHNSSASDFVRAIWAYTSALYKTSVKFNSNHPRLLIFDEPSQHDMANRDMNNFLMELSSYSNGQSIVFASFGERDENFKEETKGIDNFHLIDLSKLTKILKFQSEL